MVGICRLCTAFCEMDMVITITDTNHAVCRKLRECCQIDIRMDDTLPKYICCKCVKALQQAHSFYIKVHESQEALATLFPSIERVSNNKTLNTAKPLKLIESFASAINFTGNNDKKEAETSTDVDCIGSEIALKPEVHVKKEDDNREECETTMILDKGEVNHLLKNETAISNFLDISAITCPTDMKTLNTAKTLTLVESLARGIPLIGNNKKNEVLTEAVCVSGGKVLKMEAYVEEEKENSEECEASIHEVKDEIDEVFSTENIMCGGQKCAEKNEEELISDVSLDKHEQPSGSMCGDATAKKHILSIETVHLNSVDEEEEELEEEMEEKMEEEMQEEMITEDIQKDQERVQEQVPMQLSIQDANEVQIDTWNVYPWLCYLCSAEMSSYIEMRLHCQVAHYLQSSNKMQFKCIDCKKVFPRYNSFVNHVRFRHRSTLALCCDVCNTICSDFKHLAIHRQEQHTKNSDYPFILLCGDCGHGFIEPRSLKIHLKIHLPSKKNIECKNCGKRFARYAIWKAHQTVHSEIKEFSCEQCGKSFRQKSTLLAHIPDHVDEKNYECSICQKSFKTPSSLEMHLKTHSSVKNFKCDYCGKSFHRMDRKLDHERTHTGERPFKCGYCERSYPSRRNLKTHEQKSAPYLCRPCKHHFTNRSNYNKHMKSCHGNESTATGKVKDADEQ